MATLAGAAPGSGRRWAQPESWHLRTKLVLATMALLTAICCIVGIVSYAVMNVFLTSQLDTQLAQASHRAVEFSNRSPQGSSTERQDPLDAPGQGAGVLNARIANGVVSSAGLLALDGTRAPLNSTDAGRLAALPHNSQPSDVSLSTGDYRLVSVQESDGDVILTGLPLAAKESTLASLVWTIVLVSLAALGLTGIAGTVIIRRTMRPLETLSAVATKVARLPLDAGEVALAVRVPANASNPHTEVGNVGHALNQMLDNVANALQARQKSETKVRQFVADASHELRTPLTAIRGYTELLKMTENFSAGGQQSLSRVESQSRRMGALVEDLLLLARLDEGHALKLEDVDLSQLVIETVTDAKVTGPAHRWQLELPDEPVTVRADAGQLRQVLMNLLSNARKHTDPGTTVVTSVQRSGNGGVVLSVTDNGPGIDPAFQEQIFSRFARADAARSGTDGTTGLGLAIVEAIVEAHGGTIEVNSRPGRTEFAIRLPAAQA